MKKNRKNAFTLIELLAVIVILAIIALIATPIVIRIIEDSKNNSMLRSADNYLDAVEQALAKRNMKSGGIFNPGKCKVRSNGNLLCEEEELIIDVNGDKPNEGIIKFNNGNIAKVTLSYQNKTVVKNEENQLVYGEKAICELVSDADNSNTITPGDEYLCKVKDNMEEGYEEGYTFFILKAPSETSEIVKLILDRNIYYDEVNNTGRLVNSSNLGYVQWISQKDYNDDTNYGTKGNNNKGPVTALTYLHNATKDWNKVPNIKMNYKDEQRKYGTIITENGVTKITMKDGTVVTDSEGVEIKYINLKSRLPYRAEIGGKSTNKYLYNNLGTPRGYWTLCSTNFTTDAWNVFFLGNMYNYSVATSNQIGVRPVIEIPKSLLF